jgi:hypothetical protein
MLNLSSQPRGGLSVGHVNDEAWTFIWPPVTTRNGPPAETFDRPLT